MSIDSAGESIEVPSVSPRSSAPSQPRRPIVPMCRSAADSSVLRCTFWATSPVRYDTSSRWFARASHIILYQFDQRVVLDCYYARVLWLRGFGDQASRLTESLVAYAGTKDH